MQRRDDIDRLEKESEGHMDNEVTDMDISDMQYVSGVSVCFIVCLFFSCCLLMNITTGLTSKAVDGMT